MCSAKLALFLIVPLLFDPCAATNQGDAVAEDTMADTDVVEAEEPMAEEEEPMAEEEEDADLAMAEEEAVALSTAVPRWSTQPDKNPACAPGVPTAGSWVSFTKGKTHAECKAVCESARTLVPEPDGITEKVYKFRQNGKFHDLSGKTTFFERKVPKINYKGTGGYWDATYKAKRLRDHFYVRWEGYVEIKQKGKYTFYTCSDDGSRFNVNGKEVVSNPGWHGMRTREGSVELDAGKHAFWTEVFEGGGGAGMQFYYKGPDTSNKKILVPPAVLSTGTQKNAALILPDHGFGGKLCAGFSHQGSNCILYDACSNVDAKADNIVGDTSFDWGGDPTGFQTCQYSTHAPDL